MKLILSYRNYCWRLITKNMKQHKLPSASLKSLMYCLFGACAH